METYLINLEKTIETKHLSNFWVFSDDKTFKPIIKMSDKKIVKKMKLSPKKYIGKMITHVQLLVEPYMKKSTLTTDISKWVFKIALSHHIINKKCEISKEIGEAWSYSLNYTLEEFTAHPFKLSNIKHLIYLTRHKYIHNPVAIFGVYYTNFRKELIKLDKKILKDHEF